MHILLLALHVISPATAATATWADVITPTQEVSVGRVLRVDAGSVTLQERRSGRLSDSDVAVRDPASLTTLRPGDTVIVYREAAGTLVVAAR